MAVSLFRLHAQSLECFGGISAVRTGFFDLVNLKNLAVLADIKSPAGGIALLAGDHAIGARGLFVGIAQDRIIQTQRFGKVDIALGAIGRITTGRKVSDIKFPQFIAVRTERLTLGRSAPGKCLGKPGDHHSLFAFEIGELVGFAVAARQREVRGCVANFQISSTEESREKSSHKSKNLLCHNVLLPLCQLP